MKNIGNRQKPGWLPHRKAGQSIIPGQNVKLQPDWLKKRKLGKKVSDKRS
ncbi:MAG: hypothetical protein JHC32_07385 [Candidatus Aminicenantes bacterium]|jgi:hypothetical protein|nr:hypothetical protein [Candidatus Aminicenantes bacterium]